MRLWKQKIIVAVVSFVGACSIAGVGSAEAHRRHGGGVFFGFSAGPAYPDYVPPSVYYPYTYYTPPSYYVPPPVYYSPPPAYYVPAPAHYPPPVIYYRPG